MSTQNNELIRRIITLSGRLTALQRERNRRISSALSRIAEAGDLQEKQDWIQYRNDLLDMDSVYATSDIEERANLLEALNPAEVSWPEEPN